ncbi:heterokaryon incompatibility protein-domain-containing protein [Cladorrhinum sp. PSN332]|nr:heterokaryon incompatibility protein-domain-containing protein [Cladorrhinum sp. PSN332]
MEPLYQTDPHGKTRWHLDSCHNPDIFVNSGNNVIRGADIADGDTNIFCRTCKRAPNVPELIARRRRQNASSLTIPPDAPYGNYRLWWPRTVHYSSSAVSTEVQTTEESGQPNAAQAPPENVAENVLEIQSETCPRNPVYSERLADTEFRLLLLAPIIDTDVNRPIHVILEAFNDEIYPEYETVSYTWGGEDNDASLCRPIYVGPYWDVLLQTKNCWDMMQFLQLSAQKCHRYVWIDAICINQSDDLERSMQVAKMGQLYRCSTRTVIWLGKDIVELPVPRKYPRRRFLDDVCTIGAGNQLVRADGRVDLRLLLQRRYFSRIWVIQELLLSRHLVIPFDDMEILVSGPSLEVLSGWEDIAAQWIRYSTRGRSLNLDIEQLMATAARSQASDPRDKVFGLLGVATCSILPDYSISPSHTNIGITAHCLFHLFRPEILLDVHGDEAGENCPSWSLNSTKLSPANALSALKTDRMDPEDFHKWWQSQRGPSLDIFAVTSASPPEKQWDDTRYRIIEQSRANLGKPKIRDIKPWFGKREVDTSTAALSINLTHLFTVEYQPRFYSNYGNINAYHFPLVSSSAPSMYTFSSHLGFDRLIRPGDKVFILERHKSSSPLCLILRRGPKQDREVFKLVCCCEHVIFEVKTFEPKGKFDTLSIAELQYSLDNTLEDAKVYVRGILSKFCPGKSSGQLYGIIEDTVEGTFEVIGSMDDPSFLDTCLRHVPARFQPAQRHENGLLLCVSANDWDLSLYDIEPAPGYFYSVGPQLWEICGKWKYADKEAGISEYLPVSENAEWMESFQDGHPCKPQESRAVYMWIAEGKLKHYLKEKYCNLKLISLNSTWGTGGKTMSEIIQHFWKGGKFGEFIACPQWPFYLLRYFKITGITYEVTIE